MFNKNFVPDMPAFLHFHDLVYICALVVMVVGICCSDIMPVNYLVLCQFCMTHVTANDWRDEQSA